MKLNGFKIVRNGNRLWLAKDFKSRNNQCFHYFDYSVYIGETYKNIRILKLKSNRKQIERALNLEIKQKLVIGNVYEYDIYSKPTFEEYLIISQFLKANKIMFIKKYQRYKAI